MDIQRIKVYLDVVDYTRYSTTLWHEKNDFRLSEYIEMVRSKRKDFESCILSVV